MRRLCCVLALILGACGGEGPASDRDLDGARDAIDCAPDDPTIYPGADDTCDGHDSDCNNIVDDGLGVAHELVYEDLDHDGFATRANDDYQGCVREGWVSGSEATELDCNDYDPEANPRKTGRCDFDHDYALGFEDCDDHDAARSPGRPEMCNGFDDDCDGATDGADTTPPFAGSDIYVLDADHDGYPSTAILACTPPGGAYESVEVVAETDCAPNDPAIHPNQPDDCATTTDRNCDGRFELAYVSGAIGYPMTAAAIATAFSTAASASEPQRIQVSGDSASILLCPGTYRVELVLGGGWGLNSSFSVRGLGASRGDVVLDGGGSTRVVTVAPWVNLDQDGFTDARIENLTIANGTDEHGGCLVYSPATDGGGSWAGLALDHVAFTNCSADEGGAVWFSGFTMTLDSTTFANSSARTRAGAIAFVGDSFSMTGGGFTGTSAPVGSAIAASGFFRPAALTLTGVDLSAITNDIAVTIGANTIIRDLGANASLACDASGCTP